jgi:hypothetical protein
MDEFYNDYENVVMNLKIINRRLVLLNPNVQRKRKSNKPKKIRKRVVKRGGIDGQGTTTSGGEGVGNDEKGERGGEPVTTDSFEDGRENLSRNVNLNIMTADTLPAQGTTLSD